MMKTHDQQGGVLARKATGRRAWRPGALAIFLAGLLAGCGDSTPDPTTMTLTITTTKNLNPNSAGDPAPVVLRVYELKASSTFDGAEFSELFYDDRKTLGGDMLDRHEYEIAPAKSIDKAETISGDTKYVGFIAGYRDISKATWRAKVPIEAETDNPITVTVDALSMTAKIVESSWYDIF